MPWKQRPSGGYNWLCPLCRTQTVLGTVPVKECCWRSYVTEATSVYAKQLMTTIIQQIPTMRLGMDSVEIQRLRTTITARLRDSVAVHPLFRNKLVIDVIPERHRPYHEQLAQAIQDATHGEANTSPFISGERAGDEGSGSGAAAASGATGAVDHTHDTPIDHAEDDIRRQAAIDEKNRGPEDQQSAVIGTSPTGRLTLTDAPLQNFTPGTPEGQEILRRFLRDAD